MQGLFLPMLICAFLAGCGLGETASSAAAAGASQAEQVQQATRTEARVKQQLDAAASLDAERRKAAEAAAQ
jgi:hypothetical protein